MHSFWIDSKPGLGLKIHRCMCLKIKKVQGCTFLTEVYSAALLAGPGSRIK